MKLSRVERWILSNQFQILEALHPDPGQRWSFHRAREALMRGYELEYERLMEQCVYSDEGTLGTTACLEVNDILQMFSLMKRSYDRLDDKSGIEESDVSFIGFDGNSETARMAYCRYLRDEGKFSDLDKGDDFDSHCPMLDVYRRMLAEWKRIADHTKLTKDDIVRIISSRPSAPHTSH